MLNEMVSAFDWHIAFLDWRLMRLLFPSFCNCAQTEEQNSARRLAALQQNVEALKQVCFDFLRSCC